MSNFSRRSLVASAASLPALAVPAVAVAAVVADDDTLARIAEHRRLNDLEGVICSRISRLERALPEERRKMSNVCDRGTDLGKDDDPRWTAINDEYWATLIASDAIAWSFVERPPATAAGIVALLAYADEHADAGYLWPDLRHFFTETGRYDGAIEEEWRESLHKSLAVKLQELAMQS